MNKSSALFLMLAFFTSCGEKHTVDHPEYFLISDGEPTRIIFNNAARFDVINVYSIFNDLTADSDDEFISISVSSNEANYGSDSLILPTHAASLTMQTGYQNSLFIGKKLLYEGTGLIELFIGDPSVITGNDFELLSERLEGVTDHDLFVELHDMHGNIIGPGCVGVKIRSRDDSKLILIGLIVFRPMKDNLGS